MSFGKMGAMIAMGFSLGALTADGFVLGFQASDFGTTPVFSNVTTFDFEASLAGGLHPGLYSDPTIETIGYNVSGSLATTPSGFSAFGFQLSHLIDPNNCSSRTECCDVSVGRNASLGAREEKD